jgi:hypothetical protein
MNKIVKTASAIPRSAARIDDLDVSEEVVGGHNEFL